MTTNIDTIWAKINFPRARAVDGHFGSLVFLDENGFLDGGSYPRGLEKAGFVCSEASGIMWLDISQDGRGLFRSGVGGEAMRLLSIMASEGFEGEVGMIVDGVQTTWHLLNGRLIEDDYREPLKRCA